MPGAIETAVAAFASWATGAFITATGSSSLLAAQIVYSTAYAVGYAAVAGASYAASSALAPKAPGPSDGQLSIQQPVPFRRRVYGRAKLGGFYIYFDSKNGDLYQLIAMAAHEIDAIEEDWVSDRRVTIDGSGWVTAVNYPPNAQTDQFNPKGLDWVRIITRLGASGQTASSVLQAAFPGIIKARFPAHVPAVTGLYSAMIMAGARRAGATKPVTAAIIPCIDVVRIETASQLSVAQVALIPMALATSKTAPSDGHSLRRRTAIMTRICAPIRANCHVLLGPAVAAIAGR